MRKALVIGILFAVLLPMVLANAGSITVNPGFNLISLPGYVEHDIGNGPGPVDEAATLNMIIDDLLQEKGINAGVQYIYKFNGVTYSIYEALTQFNSFPIERDRSYWVYLPNTVPSNTILRFPLGELYEDQGTLNYNAGFTLASLPFNVGPRDDIRAADILRETDGRFLYFWNGVGWDVTMKLGDQYVGANAQLKNGQGFFLYTEQAGSVELSADLLS
jgi:hypothetical protein